MKEIGILQVGETPQAEEYFDCLQHLNMMLGEWRTERLFAYRISRDEISLTAGVGSYDLTPTRPVRIERASMLDGELEIPVYVVANEREWQEIAWKLQQNRYAAAVYYDPQHPIGKALLFPLPSSSSVKLVLYTWQIISGYPDPPDQVEATLATVVDFPPGYDSAIMRSLAERIAPSFGVQASPILMAMAAEARGKIKALNIRPSYQQLDSFLSGRGRYDIFTDSYGF
jgi:hypothetical protein